MGGILDSMGGAGAAAITGEGNSNFKRNMLENARQEGATQGLHNAMQGLSLPDLINLIAPRLDAMNQSRNDTGMENPFIQFMMRGRGNGT